jgi:hypothetical protein
VSESSRIIIRCHTISGLDTSGTEARANSEGEGEVPVLEGGEWSVLSFDDMASSGEEAPTCLVLEAESDDLDSCESLDRCNFRNDNDDCRRKSLRNFISDMGPAWRCNHRTIIRVEVEFGEKY